MKHWFEIGSVLKLTEKKYSLKKIWKNNVLAIKEYWLC